MSQRVNQGFNIASKRLADEAGLQEERARFGESIHVLSLLARGGTALFNHVPSVRDLIIICQYLSPSISH